jgi:hypothetical protein
MLKGITLIVLYFLTEMCPFAASVSVSRVALRDTIKVNLPLPQSGISTPAATIKKPANYNQSHLDSIFSRSDRREVIINTPKKLPAPKTDIVISPEDTSSKRVYNDILFFERKQTQNDELYQENFLTVIPFKNISQRFDTSLLTKYGSITKIKMLPIIKAIAKDTIKEKPGYAGQVRVESSMNWLPVILIFSLFLFTFIKFQYQKYVGQVVISLINYQVSLRLLRERNVLFRNMSLGLNMVFALNLGLFIFFFLHYFSIEQKFPNNIVNVLIYSLGLIILYAIKTFSCRLVGFLFKVQSEFAEYVHNINLFNKNIGLFLFPIVILYPYLNESLRPAVLYLGIAILAIMFLLRTIRAFQIIMRKGVSMFYLILYLCAIEILPALIVVKYSATLIY